MSALKLPAPAWIADVPAPVVATAVLVAVPTPVNPAALALVSPFTKPVTALEKTGLPAPYDRLALAAVTVSVAWVMLAVMGLAVVL